MEVASNSRIFTLNPKTSINPKPFISPKRTSGGIATMYEDSGGGLLMDGSDVAILEKLPDCYWSL